MIKAGNNIDPLGKATNVSSDVYQGNSYNVRCLQVIKENEYPNHII